MAQAVDEARKQRELSKGALASDLDRLEARVRAELNWRTRLRRDGPRLVAIGAAAVVVVGTVLVLRSRLGHRDHEERQPTSIEELTEELRELRKTIEKQNGKSGGSLAQKAILRAVTAAGSAGGTFMARQMLSRQQAQPRTEEGPGTASAG